MKQDYFIIVLSHSLYGRLQRIHVPHRIVYGALGFAGLLLLILCGVAGSYARMAGKVANYNSLRHEAELLRERYDSLQRKVKQTNEQLASLQALAGEVSVAYGMQKQLTGSTDLIAEARAGNSLAPSMRETLAEFGYLRNANLAGQRNIFTRAAINVLPNIWPVNGPLMGGYGVRSDPFSGEGAMHTGIDIAAPAGTPVHAAADGIVLHAAWNGGYGRCVIIDHGNNYQTWYAHLSHVDVIEGQEIRQGEVLGAVGVSGRSTGAHLHYEVRIASTPVNPYRFLGRASAIIQTPPAPPNEFPF